MCPLSKWSKWSHSEVWGRNKFCSFNRRTGKITSLPPTAPPGFFRHIKGLNLFTHPELNIFYGIVLLGGIYHVYVYICIIVIHVCLQTYPHISLYNEQHNLELVFKDRCSHSIKRRLCWCIFLTVFYVCSNDNGMTSPLYWPSSLLELQMTTLSFVVLANIYLVPNKVVPFSDDLICNT